MIGCRAVARWALGALAVMVFGALAVLALGAGAARAEEGNVFSNLFRYGGTTVPPSQPKDSEPAYCPSIDVPEGGAALTTPAGQKGDAASVRTQVSLGRVARECTRREDGSITVKVGVETRVLLGPSGAPGRFDVPFTIAIRQDAKVISTRTKRVAVVVAPGEAQGFATVVEDDIAVPAAASADYEIVVGLGGGGVRPGKPKPRRRAPAREGAPQ